MNVYLSVHLRLLGIHCLAFVMPFIWCHCRLYEFDSYLGPYLGLAHAVLVTIFNEPVKAALCCLVVLVVQQLDGNIIYQTLSENL